MAKQKTDDFKNMTDIELEQVATTFKNELYKLQCERFSGRIEKPHKIPLTKKNLARIYTILRERKSG